MAVLQDHYSSFFFFINLCVISLSHHLSFCDLFIFLLLPTLFLPHTHKREGFHAHLICLCYEKLTNPLSVFRQQQCCCLLCDCSIGQCSTYSPVCFSELVLTGGMFVCFPQTLPSFYRLKKEIGFDHKVLRIWTLHKVISWQRSTSK